MRGRLQIVDAAIPQFQVFFAHGADDEG
jgi:hypothetical protein